MNLLLVEDEPELAESILTFLENEEYTIDSAGNFKDAMFKVGMYEYECAIVDIMLPDGSGIELIKHLKSINPKTGIIVISARNSLEDKISGLEIGADDYLTKPFNLAELNARIKSILRRRVFGGDNKIVLNEISILSDERRVLINNNSADLTKKEYDILLYFISNKEKVLTKEIITEHIWGDDANSYDNFDFVYTHVKNLRKKLADKGCEDYIKSIYGVGYKFSLK